MTETPSSTFCIFNRECYIPDHENAKEKYSFLTQPLLAMYTHVHKTLPNRNHQELPFDAILKETFTNQED